MSTPAPRKATRAFGQCRRFYLTMSFHDLPAHSTRPWTAAALGCAVNFCGQALLPVLDPSNSPCLRDSVVGLVFSASRAMSAIPHGPLPNPRWAIPISHIFGAFSSLSWRLLLRQLPFKSLSFNLGDFWQYRRPWQFSLPLPLPLCTPNFTQGHPIHPSIGRGLQPLKYKTQRKSVAPR
jgi:hypothetical protein